MTEEQKDILISKMIDAPSTLTDEELEAILHDDELRDIYEASAMVSGACTPQPPVDIEAEWKRFRPLLHRKPSSWDWVMRVAAIFLGVMAVSGFVGRLVDYIFTPDQQPPIAMAEPPKTLVIISYNQDDAQAAVAEQPTISFPTSQPQQLAKAETSPESQAEKETEFDIDEYLRIQQARIDNELAILAAETYAEEYENLAPMLYASGMNHRELDYAIKKVTME